MRSCRWALPFGGVPVHPTCAVCSIGQRLRSCQLRTRDKPKRSQRQVCVPQEPSLQQVILAKETSSRSELVSQSNDPVPPEIGGGMGRNSQQGRFESAVVKFPDRPANTAHKRDLPLDFACRFASESTRLRSG